MRPILATERCTECGATLSEGVCGCCAPKVGRSTKASGVSSPTPPLTRRSFGTSTR